MTDYSLISLIKTLHQWRKPIVYTTGGIALLSVIISLLLPVYYQAKSVFYAASQDLHKPKKVFGYGDSELYYYGSTEDIERVLTIAKSNDVLDFLINEYKLFDHYRIDPDGAKAQYKIREKLSNRFHVIRTKYDALELTVEDRNPEMAALLANGARDKINASVVDIIKSSQRSLITSYKATINSKERQLNSILDSLTKTQLASGVFDPETQTEYLSTLITSANADLVLTRGKLDAYRRLPSTAAVRDSIRKLSVLEAGLTDQLDMLTQIDSTDTAPYNIERFSEAKGRVIILEDAYRKATNSVNVDRELLKQLESAASLEVPALHVVEKAQVPVVKHRPKRSLLVIAATFAAFAFCILGVLLIESYKDQDWSFLKW